MKKQIREVFLDDLLAVCQKKNYIASYEYISFDSQGRAIFFVTEPKPKFLELLHLVRGYKEFENVYEDTYCIRYDKDGPDAVRIINANIDEELDSDFEFRPITL